jgi:hypothetical protein
MLEAFRKITDEISLYSYNEDSALSVFHGRMFFGYATKEIEKIRESLQYKNYEGMYNARKAEENDMYIEDKYNQKISANEIDADCWRSKEYIKYQNIYRIQQTNSVYHIKEVDWIKNHGNEITDTVCYPFFFNQWSAVYDHYIRFFCHLSNYVCGIKDERLAEIIWAQLSNQEIELLKLHSHIDNKLAIVLNEISLLLKKDQI